MRVSIEAPDISGFPNGFLAFWSRLLPFHAGPVSRSYHVYALAGTYVRLIEVALQEYRLGCLRLREFWDTQESFNITAINRSISHFETCVTSMHRAINSYKRLRHKKDPLSVHLNHEKPAFATDKIAGHLRELRRQIHHLDEHLVKGKIEGGQPFALIADGPERNDPANPGNTLKTLDRLVIGSKELLFTDLVAWLGEMCREAQKIAMFIPDSQRQ